MVDTCETNMSPVAKNLMERFDAAQCVDLSSPLAAGSQAAGPPPHRKP